MAMEQKHKKVVDTGGASAASEGAITVQSSESVDAVKRRLLSYDEQSSVLPKLAIAREPPRWTSSQDVKLFPLGTKKRAHSATVIRREEVDALLSPRVLKRQKKATDDEAERAIRRELSLSRQRERLLDGKEDRQNDDADAKLDDLEGAEEGDYDADPDGDDVRREDYAARDGGSDEDDAYGASMLEEGEGDGDDIDKERRAMESTREAEIDIYTLNARADIKKGLIKAETTAYHVDSALASSSSSALGPLPKFAPIPMARGKRQNKPKSKRSVAVVPK